MSEKYFYTKELDSNVLEEAVKLRTTLRGIFEGVLYSATGDDNIELQFSRALTSSEQDELTLLVNEMSDTYDLVVRKKLELVTMAWAEKNGHDILRQFGANNIYRQKTSEQIYALSTQYPDILHTLLTGSLTTAYAVFDSMEPDDNISQEEIDEFKLRLQIVLGF